MLTLDTLNIMLAVSEEAMIEEMIVALLASPKMVVFFKKFPRLKKAITDDIPRWRESLRSRLSTKPAPLSCAVYRPVTANIVAITPPPFALGRASAATG